MAMACTKETVKSSGLNIWSSEAAEGPAPIVDIIVVQGLGADPFYTWVKKVPPSADKHKRFRVKFWKGKKPLGIGGHGGSTEVMWPRDLLVPLGEDARIATYSYESDWRHPNVKTSLRECANQFLNIVSQHRQKANERQRPIVLIGHSLGSLVIQQALVNAVHQRHFTDLRLSVAGIIFLGAPFQGSKVAMFGKWLAQLSGLDPTMLKLLEKGSSDLHELSIDFWGSYADLDIVCFYETLGTDYGPLKAQVVGSQSASMVGKRMMFLNTDHSGLNKFSGEDDPNFALLLPEIRRMVEDGALAAVAARHRSQELSLGNVHWMVSRPVNNLFTGRGELLLRIQMALRYDHYSPKSKQRSFVITGLGGQGKSEICLQVASQMREEFWGVFWVDVSKATTAESDFLAIAKLLGQPVESLCDAFRVLASAKQNFLLILDNADDPNFDYQAYFPSGTHGAVLMTSRVSQSRRYSPEQFEALEGLEDKDSKALLLKAAYIPEEAWPSYNDQAQQVVQILGSHTLALIQAGAYVAEGHCQLHQYPDAYQRQRKRLLEFRPEQAKSRYCDVYTTFEASAEVLEQSENEAAKDALCLLTILSMLDSAILPLQIFKSAWDGGKEALCSDRKGRSQLDDMSRSHVSQLPSFLVVEGNEWDSFRLIKAISQLVSLSLVLRHDLNGFAGVSMHPLAHAWAKDRQDSKQQEAAWITAGCVLALSRSDSTMWQTEERRLLPHMQSYLDIETKRVLLFGSEALIIPILLKCGWALYDMRQDLRLSHLLEDMFTGLNKNPETLSKESLPLYDLQAKSLYNLGEHTKAVKLLEQVVAIRKMTLAETHPDRLASQHTLAQAYRANGLVKKAVVLLEQVVEIRKTTLASNHPSLLDSQHELARAYDANGQVKDAVELLEQEVRIRKTTLAADHPDRLHSQHTLAQAYQANGEVVKAVKLLEQVVAIRNATLAETHPDRLTSQHSLAIAYQANGQVAEAVKLLEHVVAICKITLAKTHPHRLHSQHALAQAYRANGQVTKAVKLLEQVVAIRKTTLAETHPDRLTSQHSLASAYQDNGQVAKAIELLEQVVAIEETILAETHPGRLASQNNLALAYQANGQITEAIKLLEQVVAIRKMTLAETHPDRLASQHNLAQAYRANGQVTKAVKLLEHVVAIRKITLAETHPDRLASQNNLALAYQANGQITKAIKLLEQVVAIQKTTFAETHPDRLISQANLAHAYQANGQVA